MSGPLRGLRSLVGLLTIIPTGGGSAEDAAEWFWMVPLVGLLRGAVASAALLLLPLLPPPVVAAAALALHYLIQGFMHSDGFMDMSEAALVKRLGGDPVSVLKDPRKGSYAIASFALLLALAAAASLGSLEAAHYAAFAEAELAGAEAMAFAIYLGRQEPYDGMARPIKGSFGLGQLVASYALFAALAAILAPAPSLAAGLLLEPALVGALSAHVANRTLGYANGDSLGFAEELAYAVALAMMAHAA